MTGKPEGSDVSKGQTRCSKRRQRRRGRTVGRDPRAGALHINGKVLTLDKIEDLDLKSASGDERGSARRWRWLSHFAEGFKRGLGSLPTIYVGYQKEEIRPSLPLALANANKSARAILDRLDDKQR